MKNGIFILYSYFRMPPRVARGHQGPDEPAHEEQEVPGRSRRVRQEEQEAPPSPRRVQRRGSRLRPFLPPRGLRGQFLSLSPGFPLPQVREQDGRSRRRARSSSSSMPSSYDSPSPYLPGVALISRFGSRGESWVGVE